MTLREDLERLAERGDPFGADHVYAAAAEDAKWHTLPLQEEASGSSPSRRRRWAITGAAAAIALVAAVGIGALVGARHERTPVAATGTAPNDDATVGPAPTATSETATTTVRTPSADDPPVLAGDGPYPVAWGDKSGWIDSADPPVDSEGIPAPIPVNDEHGNQIGWWVGQLGWVDLETMSDPNYDYRAEYRELNAIAMAAQARRG
jgi:hypothetical protein